MNHDCVLFAVCSIYKNRWQQLAWNWKWVAKKLCKGRKNRSETAYRTPPPPLLARHLVVISASHRKGRPCLAGAPGSESSSVPLPQEQQLPSALCCTKHHCGVAWRGLPCPELDVGPRQRPGTGRSHPSTEEHGATSHSWCWWLPRSAGNGKKEERRELFSLEAA